MSDVGVEPFQGRFRVTVGSPGSFSLFRTVDVTYIMLDCVEDMPFKLGFSCIPCNDVPVTEGSRSHSCS